MFENLTIVKKITIGFTSILMLTAILATIGIVQIRSVDTCVLDFSDIRVPITAAMSRIEIAATDQNLQISLYAIHKDQKQLEEFSAMDKQVDQNIENSKVLIAADKELVTAGWLHKIDVIAHWHDAFVRTCDEFLTVIQDENSSREQIDIAADVVEDAYTPFMAKVDDILYINNEEMGRISQKATAATDTATFWMLTIGISSIVIGSTLAFFISSGIITTLKTVISVLSEGSEQVAAASNQVSSASQSLAEGSIEQAAGLEETSSSLEEMSSMTKQNANNAQQANTLSGEAKNAADNGSSAMTRMSTAINDIQKSSDETAKIIKVINEIAFQTNLLALNAAVEAARAGEAGKGFAVVAEEVRNLAMRSAEAAKNTSEMIEDSVKSAKNGVDIANEVGKVLEEIVTGIGKTSDLVGEIAAASQEQAQGIDQVNTAVNDMDKVTQQNAANAEESASASEELSAQAEQMNEIVNELVLMVGGSAKSTNTANFKSTPQLNQSDNVYHGIASSNTVASDESLDTAHVKNSIANRAIPLDDDDRGFDKFNS